MVQVDGGWTVCNDDGEDRMTEKDEEITVLQGKVGSSKPSCRVLADDPFLDMQLCASSSGGAGGRGAGGNLLFNFHFGWKLKSWFVG